MPDAISFNKCLEFIVSHMAYHLHHVNEYHWSGNVFGSSHVEQKTCKTCSHSTVQGTVFRADWCMNLTQVQCKVAKKNVYYYYCFLMLHK